MTTHKQSRLLQKQEDALKRLTSLSVGETLEINEKEEETYRHARSQLPDREFTARRVERAGYAGIVLTRRT